ncbi:L-2-hydroxyglutarate oxidase [Myxococcota bacterium]|nr:L-2-hydroxyglutarate oxidase [Myxococcota bacterium]
MSDKLPDSCSILIVGGGITALTTARELLARGADDIVILEKDATLAPHASSRNSGVLHAGIYYTPETLKARFCLEGNKLMREYVKSRGLTLKEVGKVIVAKNEAEEPQLDELQKRATAAGAPTEMIDAKRLAELEPYAKTHARALYSPLTACIKPKEVLEVLSKELVATGKVKLELSAPFLDLAGDKVARTGRGDIKFDRIVNVAGSFAEKVAQRFGIANDYLSLPFKGTYLKVKPERAFLTRSNIYPVPDLRNPFLGVHMTRTADDSVYAGPTAIPAFGRENYRGFEGIGAEAFQILYRDAIMFFSNPGFRSAALTEPRKYLKSVMYAEAKKLVPTLELDDLIPTEKVGIRPQLVHWPSKKLVSDFLILKHGDGTHVLNAISPAFTSSMASAKHIVDVLEGKAEASAA